VLDEGVIKYRCDWEANEPLKQPDLTELQTWRDRLHTLGLIGVYPDGIGFGNISLRLAPRQFLVSGTQTGHHAMTRADHYTLVDEWDIERNWLHCVGPLKASSESLTHAALYEYATDIQATIHVHHPDLWQQYQHKLPTTRATVPYGTPAMAREMWRLFAESDLATQRVLVMAGHEDGVIAFGRTLQEAASPLLALLGLSLPDPI